METDLFGNPDSDDTTKNAVAEVATATRKAAPKDQASPLAERLRPKTIGEVVGQKHLLGPGKPLRSAFENAHPHSMILWGPPGVGKTTLARLMADAFGLPFISISAVLGGVKDIRDAVEKATANREKTGRSTVVFVDEVHRFSKSQQDAFLPHVESGLFTFIGATTENPSFEVISALLSRSTVYVLESLKEEDLEGLLHRALEREYPGLKVNEEAEKILIGLADGDARRFLNALEVSATMAKDRGIKVIDEKFVRAALPATIRRFDKGGDNFYDQISALHKSVRGSDPDAALYWMCRMLDGGVDPLYIARRLMRMSIEDIGLADPRGMEITTNAVDIYERLGSPEGELALANAVVYLACAPKSVSVYKAFNKMRAFVKQDGTRPVPMHIRNAPTKLMQKVGNGAGYRYPPDEPGSFAAGVKYFPDDMDEIRVYKPSPRGLEIKIGEKLSQLHALNEEVRRSGDMPKGRSVGTKQASEPDPNIHIE